MKNFSVFKAQGIGRAQHIEPATIVIDEEVPHFTDDEGMKRNLAIFDTDSDILVESLCNSLPGGTLDRLIPIFK